MRNIKFVGLIQRLSCLNKSTNILSRTSVCSPVSLAEQEKRRFLSFNSSIDSSKTNSGYAGALIGAALFGTLVYQINENWKKNILFAKEPTVGDKVDDFINEVKHKVDEVKQVVEDVKEVVDVTIEIGKELELIGDELMQAEEVVGKVMAKMEQEIDAVVHEIVSSNVQAEVVLPEIPSHVQYLIVGGGTAAMSAFKSIRALDANARVLVVTEEEYKPYMRPPLSKDLWTTDDENLVKDMKFKQYNGNERSVYFLDDEFYVEPRVLNQQENGGVAILTGKRVTRVDVDKKVVKLDNDTEIGYDKCLIATGGKPRTLDVFKKKPEQFEGKVTLFRNIKDFEKLMEISKQGKHIAIVGGGFLGSELACALAYNAKKHGGKVTQVFPEAGNLGKILPEYLTKWTTNKVVQEGVRVVPHARIVGAQTNDNKIELQYTATEVSNGAPANNWLLADHVVVAVGLEPNVELALSSGFEVDSTLGGFTVNTELQARNSVWVAGDAACFYDAKLGRRRVEHHDHAVVSGRLAGENMTGAGKPYWHQSMFWSDIGPSIGFEAIGLVDSSLQTVGLFAKADESDKGLVECATPEGEEFGKGVVLYLKNDVVVGCLMWNLFRKVPIARELIMSQEKVSDFKEIAKLFQINTEEKATEE